jgi:hypothetical protein
MSVIKNVDLIFNFLIFYGSLRQPNRGILSLGLYMHTSQKSVNDL